MKQARPAFKPSLAACLAGFVFLLPGCGMVQGPRPQPHQPVARSAIPFMPPMAAGHAATPAQPGAETKPVQAKPMTMQTLAPITEESSNDTQTVSTWATQTPTRGELVMWVVVALLWRGISRRWQARRLRHQMQQRLELAMQTSLETQRHFHAMLAHELRGPLAALQLQTHQLLTQPLAARAQVHARRIRHGLRRISSLIEQLLNLTRAQMQPAPATDADLKTSVHAVLREVLEELLPSARRQRQEVALVQGGDALVRIPPFDLHTLLRNLLDNAIRYTPPGGLIEISISAMLDKVWIQVADNGPGIPEVELQRVFDPFYRIERNIEGTGLGLAIVRMLALRWQGDVELRNRSGGGLLASLYLPVASPLQKGLQ